MPLVACVSQAATRTRIARSAAGRSLPLAEVCCNGARSREGSAGGSRCLVVSGCTRARAQRGGPKPPAAEARSLRPHPAYSPPASTRMRSRDSVCRSPPPHAAERQVSPAGSTCLLPPSANRCRHFRSRQGSVGCRLFLSDGIAPPRPRRGRRAEASARGGPQFASASCVLSAGFDPHILRPRAAAHPQEKTASSHRGGCGRFVRTTRDYQPFRMFSATAATSRSRASTEAQAVWGVSDSRSGCRIPSSGLLAGSGSTA